ncbi:MAG TPA: hypothetical protein VGG28_18455 [Kofleriaceae bacterium]|jgi:hypothetical protein
MQLLETVSWRALTVLGLGAVAFVGSRGQAPPPVVVDVPAAEVDEPVAAVDLSVNEDAPTPIYFTFEADHAHWVALAPLDKPRYSKPRTLDEDYQHEVIATPSAREIAPWRGRELVVDGGCRETLESFAVIARLSGELAYASENETTWTTRSIMAHGEPVLAAKLTHCTTGSALFASTAPVRRLEFVDDPALVAKARRVMLASPYAEIAAQDWKQMNEATSWIADSTFDAMVARDTVRNVTWVSMHVHANGIGCGVPTTNFWGLFRVRPDGSLEQVTLRAVNDIGALHELLDLDGTGSPSLRGDALFPGGPIVIDAHGDQVTGDQVPFYGCPC